MENNPPATPVVGPTIDSSIAETTDDSRFSGHTTTPQPGDLPLNAPDVPSISGYEILGNIGRGGTSTVWRARHTETNREVALKLINASALSPLARRRFEREVEIAARMEHPHIARLYSSGIQGGYLYCAIELVEGITLDRFVKRSELDRRAILNLMAVICDAVQYTHQRGVIHRDLKPANILVSTDGQPHIVDFGLARAELTDNETFSMNGMVAGTLGFMSPQQAAGQNDLVDTRTDVFSLGAILYCLLTGKTPHDLSGTHVQVVRRTAEEDVIRPRAADPSMDDEIEAVLLKALAREPEARYASAGAMADDLRHYLNDEPLSVRPPTLGYFLGKKIRRYRTQLLIAAAVLLCLLGTAIYSLVRIDAAWHVAEINEQKAVEKAKIAQENEIAAAQARSLAEARLVAGLTRAGDGYAASLRYAAARRSYRDAWDASGSPAPPLAISSGLLLTCIEGSPPLLGPDGDQPSAAYLKHAGNINCVSISPDGKLIATGGDDMTIRLWDIVTGLEVCRLEGPQGRLASLAFSPDGNAILAACEEGQVRLWDVKSGKVLRDYVGHGARVASIAFMPGGQRFISAGADNTIRVFDVGQDRRIEDMDAGAMLTSIAVSPDGTTALSCSEDKVVGLWNLSTKKLTRNLNAKGQYRALCIAFSHDGKTAAAGDDHGFIHLWKVETQEELKTVQGSRSPVFSIAFSPDDTKLVAGGSDRQVRLWNVADGKQAYVFTGHGGLVRGVVFSPDGSRCVSVGNDGTARVWLVNSDAERQVFGKPGTEVIDIAVSPDGRTAWTAGGYTPTQQWDIEGGMRLRDLGRESRFAACLGQTPDGRLVVTGHGRGRVSVWNGQTGELVKNLQGSSGKASCVAVSRSGDIAASASDDATICIWDVSAGKPLRRLDASNVLAIAISPDGKTILSAGQDSLLRLWDVASGKQVLTIPGHNRWVNSVAFSHDGTKAISCSNDTTVRLWDLRAGKPLYVFTAHSSAVTSVKFSPDDQTIVSASFDGDLNIWNAATGELIRTFSGRSIGVRRMEFTPDGNGLITADQDGALCKWDLGRARVYRSFESRLSAARDALKKDPENAAALATLGQWYAFRGDWDLAASLLKRARTKGAAVSPLLMAQCFSRSGDPFSATNEFQAAIQAGEAPEAFLKLCIEAARKQGDR